MDVNKLYEIYNNKDFLLDELQDMTKRLVNLLAEENIDDLNAEEIADLIDNRGKVLWTLDQLELEAEPLKQNADDDFRIYYQSHMDKLAKIYSHVMEIDRTQYPIIQKHIELLHRQLQDSRNAQKMEQAYQQNNPYDQQEKDHPRFLDTIK